ncbi:MAG: superoxide dismutase [Chloroflexi bacterium]|nr:superoxide dismutase [Chloroflexota bacterium]
MVGTVERSETKRYTLPALPYGYKDLEPHISEEQLRIHHTKHHQTYVDGANALIEKLQKARQDGADLDMKAALKELSFHLGGHELHSRFWQNMAPAGKGGGGMPRGMLANCIDRDFGSFERFKKEFTQATNVEGAGWAVLGFCDESNRLFILQVEKHNVNYPVGLPMVMCLDMWEHAYYLDYKNVKAKFVEAFWNIVNWDMAGLRLKQKLG